MDDEIRNFIKIWITVFTSLAYCYFVPRKIPNGKYRLLSILPVNITFTVLPSSLYSLHLSGTTGLFIAWLANFKLLLFAFDQGPLCSDPFISLPHFIAITSLPIKTINRPIQNTKTGIINKSSVSFIIKLALFVILLRIYDQKNDIHPTVLVLLYCFQTYISLEIILVVTAALAESLLGLELEPQFDKPYLSTSLQNFWGKRWNLVVSGILHPTVYQPVRHISSLWIGKRCGGLVAVIATFLVSGLMHELMFFYMSHQKPTWEVTSFFVLHGVCVATEIGVKKSLNRQWQLNTMVSRPLILGFVLATGSWLFFPQLLKGGADVKALREYSLAVEFVKRTGKTLMRSVCRIPL